MFPYYSCNCELKVNERLELYQSFHEVFSSLGFITLIFCSQGEFSPRFEEGPRKSGVIIRVSHEILFSDLVKCSSGNFFHTEDEEGF